MSIKNKLIDLLGSNRVSDSPETLDAYRTDYSLSSPGTALCVVCPNDNKEIVSIVTLANESGTPITPVSSRVHFTGAALPKQGGIVVDMKNMNKIWNLDERNRKITVEPGVTWNQLYPVLAEKNLMVCSPMLPHGEQSVITTFLERSPLVIPLYDQRGSFQKCGNNRLVAVRQHGRANHQVFLCKHRIKLVPGNTGLNSDLPVSFVQVPDLVHVFHINDYAALLGDGSAGEMDP